MMGIPSSLTPSPTVKTICLTPGCHCQKIYLKPPRCTCNECMHKSKINSLYAYPEYFSPPAVESNVNVLTSRLTSRRYDCRTCYSAGKNLLRFEEKLEYDRVKNEHRLRYYNSILLKKKNQEEYFKRNKQVFLPKKELSVTKNTSRNHKSPFSYWMDITNEGKSLKTEKVHQALRFAEESKATLHKSRSKRRFQCLYCEKSFGKSSHLRDHHRTHSGERPFGCRYCGKAFSQFSNLRTHLRIHTGEKPFKCHICDKSFTQRVTLRSHMRTHSNIKSTEKNNSF